MGKRRKAGKRITGLLLAIMIVVSGFGGNVTAQADVRQTKNGFKFDTELYTVPGNDVANIYIYNADVIRVQSSIQNVKTDSKDITATLKYSSNDEPRISLNIRKPGTYHVNYRIAYSKKNRKKLTEKMDIKATIYAVDTSYSKQPVKSVSLDGTKLSRFNEDSGYFSEEREGKLNIKMHPNYKIKKIEVKGEESNEGDYKTSTEYGFGGKHDVIKNGEKVWLNYMATGTKEFYSSSYSPDGSASLLDDKVEEKFELPVARTTFVIHYYDKAWKQSGTYMINLYVLTDSGYAGGGEEYEKNK